MSGTTDNAGVDNEAMITAQPRYELPVLEDLWVELATTCSDVLAELAKAAAKKYSTHPGAARLGIPSNGMVAYLIAVGRSGRSIHQFAHEVRRDRALRTRLKTTERELNDAVLGGRSFPIEWIEAIGGAANLTDEVLTAFVTKAIAAYPSGEPAVKSVLELDVVAAAVEHHRSAAEAAKGRVVLTTIAAVIAYSGASRGQDLPDVKASLNGVVVERPQKYPTGVTLSLSDGLESIQLVATNDCPCFAAAKAIRENDRIAAFGSVGVSSRGTLSVYLESCEKEIDSEVLFAPKQLLIGLRSRGLPPRFTLGRAVQVVDAVLTQSGYLRYEPSLISSALHEPESVESLEVYFPGWGAMTNLVPTPIPQLIRMGIGLGVPKVFASSRAITRAIRDGYTSPDSPAAFIFSLNTGLKTARAELQRIVTAAISGLLREAGTGVATPPRWTVLAEGETSNEAHHEVLSRRKSVRGFDITPMRSYWAGGHVMVEGHVAHVSESLEYLVATIHTERMLQLLLTTDAFRRVSFHGPEELLKRHEGES